MAKNKAVDAEKELNQERYPSIVIDRSFSVEANRRNTDIIVWYKRLVDATIGLIVASITFTLIAVFFAFIQPMPDLYASALDGSLRRVDYVRIPSDPRLVGLRAALTTELASQNELIKADFAKKPSVNAIISRPPVPAVAPGEVSVDNAVPSTVTK